MHENILRVKTVANILKGIEQPVVFVGGATVSLYATDRELAGTIRPTEDVDVVVELATYASQARLDEKLRSLGFTNDAASGVICRYKIHDLLVDIMPTSPNVWGFSNSWYPDGFTSAIPCKLDEDASVMIFPLPYFLSSKWEAHRSRGGSDLRTSRDFEDIVYVLEYCRDFDRQLQEGPAAPRQYLATELAPHFRSMDFEEAVAAHMETARLGASPLALINKLRKAIMST